MSWTRWGSPCYFTMPPHLYVANECPNCPGSSVYVYETGTDEKPEFECCACRLFDGEFRCATEEEMEQHLAEHVAAGDHVRPTLLPGASLEIRDEWKGTVWDRSADEAVG